MKQEDLKKFLEKTPNSEKKQREIHGRKMDYVDARYVMDRLDEIAGPGHWQSKVEPAPFAEDGYAFITTISIWIDELNQWVAKTDGGGQDSNKNRAGEKIGPENDFKGALSDSFKRAAVLWGIARDLYQPEKYVDVIDMGETGRSRPIPTATPHSGGVRTSEFPPTDQPIETIESPALSGDGQASQEELKRLVQKKNQAFPYSEAGQSAEAKAFYFWMKDQALDFGKYDKEKKERYDFNLPESAIPIIDAELDRILQEPF